MQDVIEKIVAALAADATPEIRADGANACRAVLAALEPKQALAAPTAAAPNVAAIVTALRGAPPEQLLDLAIAKLRSALPDGTDVPGASPVKFNLVPVTRKGRP